MTTGFEKIVESQQQMLDQWLGLTKKMFKPFWEKPAPDSTAKKTKSDKKPKAGEKTLIDVMSSFWEQWFSIMENNTRHSLEAYQKIAGIGPLDDRSFSIAKMWKENARFVSEWMDQNWGRSSENQFGWWQGNFNEWGKQWVKMWETPFKALTGNGQHPLSMNAYHKSLFGILEQYPTDRWCDMVNRYNEFLEHYIELVNDIDLPFDEMAAAWEKVLETYTPRENMPYSILGESMGKYFEVMFYPFYGVVDPPQIAALFKIWYAIQFHTWSFLIRNAELRGMVLEASLAAWPEALKSCSEQLEQGGNTPTVFHLYQEFLDRLETHLHKLMKSADYIQVQEKIVEATVTLKSHLNKWFEVGTADLPLVTQSDLKDIAREMEALRVKIRKLGEARQPAVVEKLKNGESGALN